jgi:hypothetical protein
MITDEDPRRGLLFYQDFGVSLTLHVVTVFAYGGGWKDLQDIRKKKSDVGGAETGSEFI